MIDQAFAEANIGGLVRYDPLARHTGRGRMTAEERKVAYSYGLIKGTRTHGLQQVLGDDARPSFTVFVRYGLGDTAMGTDPRDLELMVHGIKPAGSNDLLAWQRFGSELFGMLEHRPLTEETTRILELLNVAAMARP